MNIAEILKNCPKGTKLYSPLAGEVVLTDIHLNTSFPIETLDSKGSTLIFTKEGHYFINTPEAECMLFPSRDNRDWSTFKNPNDHKIFRPGQRVLVIRQLFDHYYWTVSHYSHYMNNKHILCDGSSCWDSCILPLKGNEKKIGTLVTIDEKAE